MRLLCFHAVGAFPFGYQNAQASPGQTLLIASLTLQVPGTADGSQAGGVGVVDVED